MKLKTIVTCCCILFCCRVAAQQKVQLASPDGRIVFSLSLKNGKPFYAVAFNKQVLIQNAALSVTLDGGKPLENCTITAPALYRSGIQNYDLVVGKASAVNHPYKEAAITFKGGDYDVTITVMAFNDGVAFRYNFSSQKKSAFAVLEEQTQFNVTGDPVIKALLLPNFTTSHEGLYTTAPLSKIQNDTLMDMPALFRFPNNTFMAITEAALLDYAGMYLIKRNGILTSQLSPLPGHGGIKVKATLPHQSPWRVMLIGDHMGALIESNILTSLSPACAIKETGWIKTGTTTFPWWNGTIIPDTNFAVGNNFETNKYYIDFCADNNISYHTVVEANGHEWYMNDGDGYQPGNNVDVTKPVAWLDMKQVCDYAHSKGVGVRVWVHWKALYPKLDTAFAVFEKWGLSGMMVDFMDRDDQEMVNIQTEILQKAAAHHLHIQFHGAYKPTGLSRTYPNEFTREGTLNYECDKWNDLVTPDADLNIVFTRMLAGSTDYHLGGFRAAGIPSPAKPFKVQYTRPLVMGTRCHMLAMYVVLENYQGMLCDYPDAYNGEPGFEVLQHIPTTWDETHVTGAAIDEFVSIARRKGNNWYIGTISNHDKRQVEIDLGFLPAGDYSASIYSDADDVAVNPNHLKKETVQLNNLKTIKINLSQGGGNVIILHKN